MPVSTVTMHALSPLRVSMHFFLKALSKVHCHPPLWGPHMAMHAVHGAGSVAFLPVLPCLCLVESQGWRSRASHGSTAIAQLSPPAVWRGLE
jgi:hypothetical protein